MGATESRSFISPVDYINLGVLIDACLNGRIIKNDLEEKRSKKKQKEDLSGDFQHQKRRIQKFFVWKSQSNSLNSGFTL